MAKAVESIERQLHPPADGPVCCVDEQTGIGVREPAAPSQPAAPARSARRECEYRRHGPAALLAACCVRTGVVHAIVRRRQRSAEFIALLRVLDRPVPKGQVIHLILDPVRLHRAAEVAVYLAYRPWRCQFPRLPVHASWLSCIAAWFAILSKQCLQRSELADCAAAEQAIGGFVATYNAHQAHPFTWRKGIRFYQRLKDKLTATPAVETADADLPAAA